MLPLTRIFHRCVENGTLEILSYSQKYQTTSRLDISNTLSSTSTFKSIRVLDTSVEFFDVISKYIYRSGLCLDGSSLYKMIPSDVLKHADYWREHIRGKLTLDQARKTFTYTLPTIHDLFEPFEKIFNRIQMNNTEASSYISEVMKTSNITVKIVGNNFYIS